MEQPKVGVFISDCGKQLSEILDFDAITSFVKAIPNITLIAKGSEFWRGKGLQTIVDAVKSGKINRVVVAESLTKISDINIARPDRRKAEVGWVSFVHVGLGSHHPYRVVKGRSK